MLKIPASRMVPVKRNNKTEMVPVSKFKCEFGYYNSIGKVVIPTNDTGDYLQQSLHFASPAQFNLDTLDVRTILPPNTPSSGLMTVIKAV